VRDTVSADAPGYTVVICTWGGTISGYCATGRIASATSRAALRKRLIRLRSRAFDKEMCQAMFLALFILTAGQNGSFRLVATLSGRGVQYPSTMIGRSVRAGPITRNRRESPLLPLALARPSRPRNVITNVADWSPALQCPQRGGSVRRRDDQSNTSELAGVKTRLEFATVALAWIVPLERSEQCPKIEYTVRVYCCHPDPPQPSECALLEVLAVLGVSQEIGLSYQSR